MDLGPLNRRQTHLTDPVHPFQTLSSPALALPASTAPRSPGARPKWRGLCLTHCRQEQSVHCVDGGMPARRVRHRVPGPRSLVHHNVELVRRAHRLLRTAPSVSRLRVCRAGVRVLRDQQRKRVYAPRSQRATVAGRWHPGGADGVGPPSRNRSQVRCCIALLTSIRRRAPAVIAVFGCPSQ